MKTLDDLITWEAEERITWRTESVEHIPPGPFVLRYRIQDRSAFEVCTHDTVPAGKEYAFLTDVIEGILAAETTSEKLWEALWAKPYRDDRCSCTYGVHEIPDRWGYAGCEHVPCPSCMADEEDGPGLLHNRGKR